jgi:hypothetical protein
MLYSGMTPACDLTRCSDMRKMHTRRPIGICPADNTNFNKNSFLVNNHCVKRRKAVPLSLSLPLPLVRERERDGMGQAHSRLYSHWR